MPIKSLNPYINFNGTAAQAIALYERVLGAKKVNITHARDVPGANAHFVHKDHIVHGVLTLGGAQLMVSDGASQASAGANVQVALDFSDLDEMTQKFTALADGGTVAVPLQDTFWGKFGMLIDRFGVGWMFSYAVAR